MSNKRHRERSWFQSWVTESYSIRQLCQLSGYSRAKLHRIKDYWLSQKPPAQMDLRKYHYALFDGTYFHQEGCLVVMMDAQSLRILETDYIDKESYHHVLPLFTQLRQRGLLLKGITVDGHRFVMAALRDVWPTIVLQRCLYHIQRQGLSWIRFHPKTQAGRELQDLLKIVTGIKSMADQKAFQQMFENWSERHRAFVRSLPWNQTAYKDLKRTMGLLLNAWPNMFHYLKDQNLRATTNALESFYSRLKADFQRHRGLSKAHKIAYLRWYCYFENQRKTNTI